MIFIVALSGVVIILHLLKLISLWFKPAFLRNSGLDKTPSAPMLTAYYLLTVLVLLAYCADRLGYVALLAPR